MNHCPDKKCRPLAVMPLVDGFICVGKLAKPTDHVVKAANDLGLCYQQEGRRHQWHINDYDIVMFYDLLTRAMQADQEERDALRKKGPEGDGRPGG